MTTVRQLDVAQRAEVSVGAVAFALSENPERQKKLRPETRQRIIETARQLGYRPHRHAQLMRGKKSGVIGMIHFGGLMQFAALRAIHVANAVHHAGYRIFADDLIWYPEGVRAICEAMVDARVEGVVLVAPSQWFPPVELERFQRLRIPVVAVSGMRLPGVPHVCADSRQGMFDLTQHLIRLGHRRLTLLTRTTAADHAAAQWPVMDRVGGFRDAVAAGPGVQGDVFAEDQSVASWIDPYRIGAMAMQKVLARGERPDAVLCTNDDWALGAMAACAEAGVRVPQDVALTGFDNAVFGDYLNAKLTTVAQPSESMAQKAMEILVRLIRGETLSADEEMVKLPCRVVVRQSCGSNR